MNDMMKDPMVLRQIIMDHDKYPRNRELVKDDRYLSKHMASDSCIDDIEVQALIEDGKLKDIRFDGVACTISTAATSIMTELLNDKSIDEAKEIVKNYRDMIDEKPYDEDLLEEAIAFQNVGRQANRIHCATIGWDAIEQIMEESEK
ncbi:Fe-S cluster assembly sulfur transfer protein SufU [Breznakia pachnodae]|jgi:nitrogen fixation NifU-like protein|uniref:Nitrogen fixation NifU-like protein n=1 Tax=Breznakia pachnodae TaxID=265178 RepID=A0ABU0DXC6_9FIRM|nr:SUF system NifU family Fe-S cluster assembly protein [Breznakia pachnodae]MDQ0359289.1 nitrogen fixation NifU-like protein [Breznakia pachnodae]